MRPCSKVIYLLRDRVQIADRPFYIAFPLSNTKLETAYHYGSSLWGKIAKLVTRLADGTTQNYFLKVRRMLLCSYHSDATMESPEYPRHMHSIDARLISDHPI